MHIKVFFDLCHGHYITVSGCMLFLAICNCIVIPSVLVFVISLNDSSFPVFLLEEGKVSLPIFDKTSEFLFVLYQCYFRFNQSVVSCLL